MITYIHSNARSKEPMRLKHAKKGCWIHVDEASGDELKMLAHQFELDEDLLLDALDPYESPRIERDSGVVYVFTRYHLPGGGTNSTDTLLIVLQKDYLITIMRSKASVLQRLLTDIEPVVTTQQTKLLLQILEEVNDSYRYYISQVTKQLFAVRSSLSKKDFSRKSLLMFIDLEDDLQEFLSALQPQAVLLRNLLGGKFIRLYEEDKDLIEDLTLGTGELIELSKSRVKTMSNIRQAYDAIASNELNRIFRRLTSITIFLMVPTLIFSMYGMNLGLPFADNPDAFWYVTAVVLGITLGVIYAFRRRKWL